MFSQKKPYSAVTVQVERLTSESFNVDDLSGIPDLVEVIKLQASGPSEAARAIRKKLKYGNVHRQLRALVILDGLIQNAGSHFQRAFADEPLLERLRVCGSSDLSDPAVKRKCAVLFREWSRFASTPGLDRVARLHKELPKRKVTVTQEKSRVIRETDNPFEDHEEDEAVERASRPAAAGSSSRTRPSQPGLIARAGQVPAQDKKKKKEKDKIPPQRRPFDIEKEKEKLKAIIAESSIESTSLMNTLQSINREQQRISENRDAVQHFEACKQLRRRILRYIHLVESEQWLGSLLHANDELVHALMSFEQLDQSIDADSDFEDELAQQAHMYKMATLKSKDEKAGQPLSSPNAPDLAGLSLEPTPKSAAPPIPRPSDHLKIPARPSPPIGQSTAAGAAQKGYEDDDDDDPFSDKNMDDSPSEGF